MYFGNYYHGDDEQKQQSEPCRQEIQNEAQAIRLRSRVRERGEGVGAAARGTAAAPNRAPWREVRREPGVPSSAPRRTTETLERTPMLLLSKPGGDICT
jgi:hypothetical protein